MIDEAGFRGRSLAESEVVHAVWDELGGELVEEFVVPTIPGERSRAREIDGLIVAGARKWHRARTPLALAGRDVTVCQAKAGTVDFGVLGQTLFGGELIVRQHRVASLRLIAAAVKPNALVERMLHGYRPLGRTIEYRTYPHLRLGKSGGAEASAVLRKVLVETLHRDQGGLLITYGDRLSRSDFNAVRANGVPDRPVLDRRLVRTPRPVVGDRERFGHDHTSFFVRPLASAAGDRPASESAPIPLSSNY